MDFKINMFIINKVYNTQKFVLKFSGRSKIILGF